ncbi:MAG: hypothetical protein K2I70_03995, partial [Bacilli bacterium]|nr:hypothetical protein [Bacilli bacterium]
MNIIDNTRIIYEDNEIMVSMVDDLPTSNGEMILTTKNDIDSLFDLDMKLLEHIHETLKRMKDLIYNRLNPDGIKIVNNYGKCNMDNIFCIKIIPYYEPQQPLVD